MENRVLRQTLHGLDKKQVLKIVDEMLMLKVSVESGAMTREQALAQAQQLAEQPIKTAFSGFREEDVRQYLRDLVDAI